MSSNTTPYDPADHIHTEEEALLYLQESIRACGGSALFLSRAIEAVIRARQPLLLRARPMAAERSVSWGKAGATG